MRLCECSLAGVCAYAVIYRLPQGIENKSGSRCSCVCEEEHRQAQDPIDCHSSLFLYIHYLNCYFSVLFTEKTSSAFKA